MVKAGFKLLKPTMDLSTNLNLWWNLWNDKYVEGFHALNKWANEYVAFPGEFFRQWVRDFYQDNKLYRGELVMGGRPVRLERITCPVFVVGAKEDYIAPPACVRALMDAVGSRDKEYIELPGGHISLIAGRGAAVHCWPKVSAWLDLAHSTAVRAAGRPRAGAPPARAQTVVALQAVAELRPMRRVTLSLTRGVTRAYIDVMADASGPNQLFELWSKQFEEGAQAWSRLITQTPAPPARRRTRWRSGGPCSTSGVQTWARLFAQTPATPDLMTQWKQFLDQSIEAWSRALGQAMNTEQFAQMMGRSLDQWLVATAPVKKVADQQIEQSAAGAEPASRSSADGVAKQLVELEERIDRLEDSISAKLRQARRARDRK